MSVNKMAAKVILRTICVVLSALLVIVALAFTSLLRQGSSLSKEAISETGVPQTNVTAESIERLPETSISGEASSEESIAEGTTTDRTQIPDFFPANAQTLSTTEPLKTGTTEEQSQHPGTTATTGTEELTQTLEETQASVETTSETTVPADAEFVVHGNTEVMMYAFTFDDSGEGLANILEILDRKGVKGSFFLLAGELRKNPELWQQAAANGHLILNHTVNHYTDLAQRSEETIRAEILGWEDAAREVLGEDYLTRMKKDFPYFRSPGGLKSDRLLTILGDLGYSKMFYWTVEDVYFSKHNPDGISMADHYIQDVSNGGVFLMHPGNWGSVEEIIDRLVEDGYACVPVSEIFN